MSDSVIYKQIDILNNDYQRLNADTTNLRSIFQPIAGNPNVNFILTHIERIQTTSTFTLQSNLYDAIKHSSSGGSDAWNTSNYLNIWVGALQWPQSGPILGYAYPPVGAPGWGGWFCCSNT